LVTPAITSPAEAPHRHDLAVKTADCREGGFALRDVLLGRQALVPQVVSQTDSVLITPAMAAGSTLCERATALSATNTVAAFCAGTLAPDFNCFGAGANEMLEKIADVKEKHKRPAIRPYAVPPAS
jgi:hypothetical protein